MTIDLARRDAMRPWKGGPATLAVTLATLAVVSPVLASPAGPAGAAESFRLPAEHGRVEVGVGRSRSLAGPWRPAVVPASRPVSALVFRWPVDGPARVVRPFDPPPRPWLPGHRGVDLAGTPGGRVRAAGDGVVLFAGMVAGRPVVTVGHTGGLRTTYEPVRPTVRAGTAVPAGTPLGELSAGHPGCTASACLHWGLLRGTEYLDPLALLGPVPVRLLPVGAPTPGEVVPVVR